MAICRICGAKFKVGVNTAEEICNNDDCWATAWNEAVAPFRGDKVHTVKKSKRRRRTTPYQREQIIKLYKDGDSRKLIAIATGVSYEVVCKTIASYKVVHKTMQGYLRGEAS